MAVPQIVSTCRSPSRLSKRGDHLLSSCLVSWGTAGDAPGDRQHACHGASQRVPVLMTDDAHGYSHVLTCSRICSNRKAGLFASAVEFLAFARRSSTAFLYLPLMMSSKPI